MHSFSRALALCLFLLASVSAHAATNLTLNKTHTAPVIAIGAPFTYNLKLTLSGDANAHVSISEQFPPGFVFVDATCTGSAGATCPGTTLTSPVFGEFTMPNNGVIDLAINGYFTSGGSKTNTATAGAKDGNGNAISVGGSNVATDVVTLPFNTIGTDLSVTKCIRTGPTTCVSTSTASFPGTMRYEVTVSNLKAQDIYLGDLFELRDLLSNSSSIPITYNAGGGCAPAALCPDSPLPVSGTLGAFSNSGTQLSWRYDTTAGANDLGFLPGNSSFKIEFDVTVDKQTNACKTGNVNVLNQAFIFLSNGSQTLTDEGPGGNSSVQTNTSITGNLPPDCPPQAPGLTVSKIQVSPALNQSPWNGPVQYRITITNPAGGTARTNLALTDDIFKQTGTPTFTATVDPLELPECVSGTGCTSPLTNVTVSSPTVNLDSATMSLWTATLPSLAPGEQAVIEYTVSYAPVCETDARADHIINRFFATSTGVTSVTTTLPEFADCLLQVVKTKETSGDIVFGQPFSYEVVYTNLSGSTLNVGTVADAVSIASNRYGNVPFSYTVSCDVTAGSVTPAIAAFAGSGTASHQPFGWQGARILSRNLTFTSGAALTCNVTITASRPALNNPFCQGIDDSSVTTDNAVLVNAAFMDLSANYFPTGQPQPKFYDEESAALPLCRDIVVDKVANDQRFSPGDPIVYTISVRNEGDDPVSSLMLTDVVQAPLTATGVSPCTPPADCSSGPALTGNQVNVAYATLAPDAVVSFDLSVTAPQAGGSYPNLAQASFPAAGSFYFRFDDPSRLEREENIQVVTPSLAKSYSAGSIGPNGTSTLTFTVTNTNDDPQQSGLSFSDTLGNGLTAGNLVSNTCGGSVAFPSGGGTIALTGGQLAAGQHSCQIVVVVQANGVCGIHTNDSSNFSNVNNLDVSAIDEQLEVTGCQADVRIAKSGPASIVAGGQVTYTITATNQGPDAATNVVVTDVLPAGLTLVSATPSQGTCSGTTTVLCNLGTLPNGTAETIQLIADVTATSGSIANTASIDGAEPDPTPANDSATATAVVGAAATGIPTASTWALLGLAAMLGVLAVMRLRL